MSLSKQPTVLSLLLILLASPVGAQKTSDQFFEVSASKYLLGTKVEIKALCRDILTCQQSFYDAFMEIQRIEDLLSYSRNHSEISAINRSAGVVPVKVSEETYAIIQRAVNYAARFDGIFDITIGSVTILWGFSDNKEIVVPDPDDLAAQKGLVDYRRIIMSQLDTTIYLERTGMRLDLGGIAKGYAIDRAASILKSKGLTNFIIDAGGDIYAAGHKMGDQNWLVGIQHPRQPNELLATFEIHDAAVATSGDYERYKIIDGHRYHHIIDPRTGFPATPCQSVTIFANSAEEADAWATYCFIIGPQELSRLQTDPEIRACFIEASGAVKYDPSIVNDYHLNFFTNSVSGKDNQKPNQGPTGVSSHPVSGLGKK